MKRARSEEWVWERLERVLPDIGITRVGNLTGLDTVGIPVWAVYRPGSRSMAVSLGKALTDTGAKISAVMESIETYCGERIAEPLLHGNVADLGGRYPLMALEGLPRVPGAMPLSYPIYWIQGRDVGNGGIPCWVPYEMVHTRYMPAARPYFPQFVATTRGLAAGSTRIEAVCHAVLELIEGDANAKAYELPDEEWEARTLDLDTVDDPDCLGILERCRDAGLTMLALDSTTPMGIASFLAVVLDRDDGWRVVPAARGMGCHPSRAVALQRALLEAVQSRAALISGAREDLTPKIYRDGQDPRMRDAVRELAKRGAHRWEDVPTREWKTIEDDLHWVMDTLTLWRMPQVIVVDVDPDGFPFPVVRVIIPWLRAEVVA